MADKYCPQCGEKVDEAKAFCPACGHAFVEEEKRTDTSAYEKADHTMQMGQTMYNSMLSDMGLNLKKEPEKRIEVLKPVVQSAQTLQPVAGTQTTATPEPIPASAAEPQLAEKKSSKKLWIVTIVVALALLLILAAAVIGVGAYLYWKGYRL